jgi:predicted ATPase
MLLAERRLLTLTGPGGSGKTCLALAVAGDVAEDFQDGVWWVPLAALSEPELVSQAVASVLEVRERPGRSLTETLTDHLASGDTLLILQRYAVVLDLGLIGCLVQYRGCRGPLLVLTEPR